MKPIAFTQRPARGKRCHFVTEADVRVVLERLPPQLWSKKLKAVHFNDRGKGRRIAGYVIERNEISLCALPQRVSLTAYLRRRRSPSQFGAIRGCQWPQLAVRRFMLYDVFLHELGHLQVVDHKAKTTRRKFAGERLAQDFAEYWRGVLWSRPFDHPDPVHNPPSPEELAALHAGWGAAHRNYKLALIAERAKRFDEAVLLLTQAVAYEPGHAMALEQLGLLTYSGMGTNHSTARTIELLSNAIRHDPTLLNATVFLGFALAREDREAEARQCFERAVRIDAFPPIAMSAYADVLADWGYFAESEALFRKALKKNDRCVLALRDYARCLLRQESSDEENNLGRAIELFERAVAVDPKDAQSHYRLGDALSCIESETERAIDHLQKALKLDPECTKAAEALAEIEADRLAGGSCLL